MALGVSPGDYFPGGSSELLPSTATGGKLYPDAVNKETTGYYCNELSLCHLYRHTVVMLKGGMRIALQLYSSSKG